MPRLREHLAAAHDIIIESNSVMRFLRPDLYIVVLDPMTQDFKDSSREFLDRADAILLHQSPRVHWKRISLKPVSPKPTFVIQPPPYVTPELVGFVQQRIGTARSA
jgi:hypothetical protein